MSERKVEIFSVIGEAETSKTLYLELCRPNCQHGFA